MSLASRLRLLRFQRYQRWVVRMRRSMTLPKPDPRYVVRNWREPV